MEQFKGIPYGISNFKQLRRENLYFVDKSHYIQKLEESGHILELKYLKKEATEADAQKQWAEAVVQIRKYADGQKVRQQIQYTTLHTIVVQIRGYELNRMEEII